MTTTPMTTTPMTTTPATTIPVTARGVPSEPETSSPGRCGYGAVAVLPTSDRTASVCLHVGATLTATFDKSAGGYGGPAGAWEPLEVHPALVLRTVSDSPDRQLLKAVFVASSPGTAWVSAGFQTVCSSTATPCTIPPSTSLSSR